VTDSLPKSLLRRSEAGRAPVIWGGGILPTHDRTVAAYLGAGLLVERAPATTWPPCDRCDGSCGERDVLDVGGALVAECPDYPDRSRTLLPHELRSFAIVVTVVVAALARASDLSGGVEEVARGAWHLGATESGRDVVLVLDETVLHADDAFALLAHRLRLATVTLLVPEAAVPSALRRWRDTGCHVRTTISALAGDELRLDPRLLAPPSAKKARLVIDTVAGAATLDGRLLDLTVQPYRLLLALARAAQAHPGFVGPAKLEAAIYEGATQPPSRLLSDIVRELRDRMGKGLGKPEAAALRALIANRPPGEYRLTLGQTEIALVP
jgi:hypothetical protein